MSRRRRTKTSYKLKVNWEIMQKLASVMTTQYGQPMDGYILHKSSGVWRKADGSFTFRLVYRNQDAASALRNQVLTVRNVRIDLDAAEA
ncbi:hypothetical protein [Brucella tritici]|uniref:Uncharacterized protein n=1 Tax=Brucella tritici TaxID=94626 RepID=A0A6L3YU22_9HYPH|nr:hypothetical protein [Brucella tritici]KAB2687541.1 hypothetical protein F9L08_08280 [Brucella tritici]